MTTTAGGDNLTRLLQATRRDVERTTKGPAGMHQPVDGIERLHVIDAADPRTTRFDDAYRRTRDDPLARG